MDHSTRSALIGLLVAVVAGTGAYMLWPQTTHAPSEEDMTKQEESKAAGGTTTPTPTPTKTTTQPKTTPTTTTQPVTRGGTYENYTAGAVGYAALGEVVLFFHSVSCPACELLDKDIKVNATRIPKDVKILKIDYDTATDLKQRYGVSSPHVLIQVNSKGDRITQWNLSSTLSDLVTRIVRY